MVERCSPKRILVIRAHLVLKQHPNYSSMAFVRSELQAVDVRMVLVATCRVNARREETASDFNVSAMARSKKTALPSEHRLGTWRWRVPDKHSGVVTREVQVAGGSVDAQDARHLGTQLR